MTKMKNRIQELINQSIPISQHIHIKVEKSSENKIILTAPLARNKNDKNSAFGGSIYSVAVLAGWSLIMQEFIRNRAVAEAVIYSASITYHKPILDDFYCIAQFDQLDKKEHFYHSVQQNSSSKIKLKINIYEQDQIKAVLDGKYYGWLK